MDFAGWDGVDTSGAEFMGLDTAASGVATEVGAAVCGLFGSERGYADISFSFLDML